MWVLRANLLVCLSPCSTRAAPELVLEPEITLVLSPITTSQRRAEAGSVFPGNNNYQIHIDNEGLTNRVVTIPSVGDSLEALDDLCSELAQTLKQIADLGAELSNREHISVDNVHEVRIRYSSGKMNAVLIV